MIHNGTRLMRYEGMCSRQVPHPTCNQRRCSRCHGAQKPHGARGSLAPLLCHIECTPRLACRLVFSSPASCHALRGACMSMTLYTTTCYIPTVAGPIPPAACHPALAVVPTTSALHATTALRRTESRLGPFKPCGWRLGAVGRLVHTRKSWTAGGKAYLPVCPWGDTRLLVPATSKAEYDVVAIGLTQQLVLRRT
jgi:hypothetical protein